MTRPNEYQAYFTVVGDFDPASVTAHVGLEPTSAWRKGETNPKTLLERKFSRWCLDSRLDKFCSLEEQIADVLEQMTQNESAFKEMRAFGGGGMQLVGCFYGAYPGLHLDTQLVAELARFELSVDFDFYYLYSDSREDS